MPKISKLEIEGLGYHSNLYAIRGIYFGGKEGNSMFQWFRAMSGSPDLILIPGRHERIKPLYPERKSSVIRVMKMCLCVGFVCYHV